MMMKKYYKIILQFGRRWKKNGIIAAAGTCVRIEYSFGRISYRFIAFCGYSAQKPSSSQDEKKEKIMGKCNTNSFSIDRLTTSVLLCLPTKCCCLLYRFLLLLVECMQWIDNMGTQLRTIISKNARFEQKENKSKTHTQMSRKIFSI